MCQSLGCGLPDMLAVLIEELTAAMVCCQGATYHACAVRFFRAAGRQLLQAEVLLTEWCCRAS